MISEDNRFGHVLGDDLKSIKQTAERNLPAVFISAEDEAKILELKDLNSLDSMRDYINSHPLSIRPDELSLSNHLYYVVLHL